MEEKKLAQTESDRWEEGRKLERELANKLRTKMGSKPRAENELKSLCSTIKNVINDHENDVLTWKQKLLGDCLSN